MIAGRRRLIAAPILIAALAGPSLAAEPAGETRLVQSDGWQRFEARLPGRLVSYALPRIDGGPRGLVALVDPGEPEAVAQERPDDDETSDDSAGPRVLPPCHAEPTRKAAPLALYRLDPRTEALPQRLHDRIPHDVGVIDAADLDGDGNDELLLARPGELFVFVPGAGTEPGDVVSVLSDPDLRWNGLHPRAVATPALDGWPAAATFGMGSFDVFGPGADPRHWIRKARVELPVEGEVLRDALVVRSVAPTFVGRRNDSTWLFATPARARGGQRVETTLIEIPATGEARRTESWSRLPGRERILEQEFLMLDDEPVLLLTTKTADKLDLFGEKQLRLFPVARDRSRLGRHPSLAAATRMNLWQAATPFVVDVDADGDDDLVLGYWKGLKDDRVVLDAYVRSEDGSFAEAPRSTAFDVDGGDRSFVVYGRDLDADGVADLLLRNESGELLLFRGLRSRNGKKLVAKAPERLPLGDRAAPPAVVFEVSIVDAPSVRQLSPNAPRLIDLDDDGRPEILLVDPGGGGDPATFDVLRPRSAP